MSARALRWLWSLGVRPRDARTGPPRLTIVRHHRVYADGERALYHLGVSQSVLAGQLAVCAGAGLTPVSVAEALARLERGTPGHVVAFTFDDGYADNVTRALPLLEAAGARATFYLTAGLMEERRAPWWDELAYALEHATRPRAGLSFGGTAMVVDASSRAGRTAALRALLPALRVLPAEQSARLAGLREALGVSGRAMCELAEWPLARKLGLAGMEVGAHTLTHPFLTLLSPDSQRREMADSAALVRTRLGAGVPGVAYPNGDCDAHTVRAAREAGFAYAVTTRSGDVAAGSPRWELSRRPLSEGACLAPGGRFSSHMLLAEISGAFDRLRSGRQEAAS